jgi:hypothetical protein
MRRLTFFALTSSCLLSLSACNSSAVRGPQLPLQPGLNQPNLNQDQPPVMLQAESVASRTVRTLSFKIMRNYDHNTNGQIDYRTTNTFWKSLIGRNESERRQSSYSSANQEATFRVWTYAQLFLAADRDRDGIATQDEIATFITEAYDKDHDGILQTRGWWRFWKDPEEWEFFKREMKEDLDVHRIPFNFKPPAGGQAEAAEAEANPGTQHNLEPLFSDPAESLATEQPGTGQ